MWVNTGQTGLTYTQCGIDMGQIGYELATKLLTPSILIQYDMSWRCRLDLWLGGKGREILFIFFIEMDYLMAIHESFTVVYAI